MRGGDGRLAFGLLAPALGMMAIVAVGPLLFTVWESLHLHDLRMPWRGQPFVGTDGDELVACLQANVTAGSVHVPPGAAPQQPRRVPHAAAGPVAVLLPQHVERVEPAGHFVDPLDAQPTLTGALVEKTAEAQRRRQPGAVAQTCSRLVHHVVRGEQARSVGDQLPVMGLRRNGQSIGAAEERDPGAGVDQDRLQPVARRRTGAPYRSRSWAMAASVGRPSTDPSMARIGSPGGAGAAARYRSTASLINAAAERPSAAARSRSSRSTASSR